MAAPSILCIGSVLWDVIGRTPASMRLGADVPGRISRIPGGVALNIAMALRRAGLSPVLLSSVGRDGPGDELVARCKLLGLDTAYLHRSDDLPTDTYMAIEGAGGLVAALADAHSLEAAGDRILAPLRDGRLGSAEAPYPGLIALDGNLTETLLAEIAESPLFAAADLRVAPASPGKAERLLPLLGHGGTTLYLNREEAGLLAQRVFEDAESAARALVARGAGRVLVTDGGAATCDASAEACHVSSPPPVMVERVTGAGDTFMAAHIAAEAEGKDRVEALAHAQAVTAAYVSGETRL
ncbi:PfkB family carbohydrate kinase [Vannielia litorea]|uniref:Sugar or nucleoside kinase, ribokinase family n=1 Tax=Vannielia litorea TaxID=1217970 RepID=A0A1N6F8I2_9RHOB|nr:PfkB family carbohydrate kinase [Vannielia litorea]SIN91608.1 Sugar or nucleoside kinase, ribokinase family [Vannielia litorea]